VRFALYLPTVGGALVDLYGAAFVARFSHRSERDLVSLTEPGIRGVVGAGEKRIIRLVVLDDRGYGRLATEVGVAREGVAHVLRESLTM